MAGTWETGRDSRRIRRVGYVLPRDIDPFAGKDPCLVIDQDRRYVDEDILAPFFRNRGIPSASEPHDFGSCGEYLLPLVKMIKRLKKQYVPKIPTVFGLTNHKTFNMESPAYSFKG